MTLYSAQVVHDMTFVSQPCAVPRFGCSIRIQCYFGTRPPARCLQSLVAENLHWYSVLPTPVDCTRFGHAHSGTDGEPGHGDGEPGHGDEDEDAQLEFELPLVA